MSKRTVWVLGTAGVLCLAALGVWLGKNLIWTSVTEIQRDYELKAHETLLRSIEDNARAVPASQATAAAAGSRRRGARCRSVFLPSPRLIKTIRLGSAAA